MRKRTFLAFGTFILIHLCFVKSQAVDADKPFDGTRDSKFDSSLVKNILKNNNENVIFSPFPIKVMLALLFEATGVTVLSSSPTKQELSSVLSLDTTLNSTRNTYARYQNLTEDSHPDCSLQLATRLYVDDFIDVISRYEISLNYHYNVSIGSFSSADAEQSAKSINSWFSHATKGRISGVVRADQLAESVISVLNANVLKAFWKFPFPQNGPMQKFNHRSGKSVLVPFMELQQTLYYQSQINGIDAQVLRLPFKGGLFSMYLILPHENSSIQAILEEPLFPNVFSNLVETKLRVLIPKFKFDDVYDFKEILKNIGIQQIFSENASLPLLARGRGTKNKLKLSNLIQKTGIVLNEQGSEIAAVSGSTVTVSSKLGDTELPTFNANRPFIFLIEDDTQGTLLFAGKLEDPSS
ncbi:serine protease inhibitor 2-like [Uranotaenia lowii]|uniref:serine protease inhibitor 2-like n=1 Tax=Uranotaenia lowii TaxID=190385 RepID=UPI00247833A7|nr:serine protease inhibitor 2-like [Uranotaenia lowii]